MNPIEEFYKDSTVLITGANGFLVTKLRNKKWIHVISVQFSDRIGNCLSREASAMLRREEDLHSDESEE